MLLVEWSRFLLYQVSIQTAMSRVRQQRRDISSCSRVEKNDSAAALSSAQPTRPIDWVIPSLEQAAANASEVYWADSTGRRNTS